MKRGRLLKNKSGLSAVVTTLIIILLVLVAVGIIWVVIRNVISSGAGQIELSQKCFAVDFSSVSLLPVSGQAGNYSVTLTRSSGGEPITGIKISLFNSTANSGVLEFGVGMNPLDTKTKTIDFGITNANKFDITPYFTDQSGNEQLCSQTRSFSLGSSGSAIPSGPPPGGGTGDPGTGTCGDGLIQNPNGDGVNEVCDGTNLNGQTCSSLGLGTGTPNCFAPGNVNECTFDTSTCSQAPPSSCDGTWDAQDVGVNECDGTPLPNNCQVSCICEVGFSPDGFGACTLNPSKNNGTIFSVWPSGAVKYFDSEDLPIDVSGYTNYSVNFTNSAENGCFKITFAEYLDTNGRSYLRTEFIVNINPTEEYFVWEAANCGQ